MTPGPNDALHPATVAAAAFTAFLGPTFANELAAYTIIFLGWFGGVLFGLARLPKDPPWSGWRVRLAFVLGTLVASVFLTVALASLFAAALSSWVPGMTATTVKDWLFLVSAAIPAVGHNWPDLLAWSWRTVKARVEARVQKGDTP